MAVASGLLAGYMHYLQESDAELVRCVCPKSFFISLRIDVEAAGCGSKKLTYFFFFPWQPSTVVLSPLFVFLLLEAVALCTAFFALLPQTMDQARAEDSICLN